ncbi:putative dehydrogenase [Anseongella ginsenosidimutans]|uniref:Putative dehydrogenase n=1 Tax=Anseongella ginsenosidimutans TaxID=496056 RepID=A0A4R3KQT7_9SPHI|nr:Gfo/Idh/MocA family oxidoreductase [Anseongella ginsenosidimutans]TCS87292.1 putative dehydrogenase [Anseongella ginsenosidimutans]
MAGPFPGPGGKLRHACIGVGGMGAHDLKQFMAHAGVEIVALCDVDENHLKTAAEMVPGARTYTDWRELLKEERKNIDSVNVTVPDHNHFVIAREAIRRRKHVYCQKPMCHDVKEVRVLTEAAVKAGVITQLGTQVASSDGDRTGVQWIKEQPIGKVKHIYLCSNRPGAIKTYRLEGPRPEQGQEPPANLNWDLWLGTAPERPYAPTIYHPAIWRSWQDFGTGWSGDIGCHIFDAVWKGLGLKAPKTVIAEVQESWKNSPERNSDTWPQGDHITWVFPGNEMTESDELTIEWFDGEFYPPEKVRALFSVENYPAESAMLIGTEGALLIPHGGMPVLLPESKFATYPHPALATRNHYHHFVDACLGGEKTESHFAQSGPMTEAILLGTVAIRVPGQLLEWDPVKMRFPNHPEAEQLLERQYRKGWR